MLRDYIQLPRPVHILCLGILVTRAGAFFMVFLTIYVSEHLGLGLWFATLAIGVFGCGATVGSLIGGQCADLIGRRTVMLVSLFGGAFMLLVLSCAIQRWSFLLSVFAFATINEMFRPAAAAMFGDLVPPRYRAHAFGLMYISVNLGFAIAPPIGGLLSEYSFTLLFWGDALTTVIYGLIVFFLISETLSSETAEHGPAAHQKVSLLSAAKVIVRDIPFVLFCGSTLLITLVFMQAMSTLPIHIRQAGYSKIEFGWLMAINGVLIVIAQLPLTQWLSRFDQMHVITIGGALISVGFGLNGFGDTLPVIAMAVLVWTCGEMFQAPFNQAVVTDMAPAELRGRYLGVFSMSYSLAMALGAPLGGFIFHRYGSDVLWTTSFVVGMSAVVLYISIRPYVLSRTHAIS